ncbi:ATP-dependent helicase, partial [bacterium]|nr:ATP-dependent helicase [bacterium]
KYRNKQLKRLKDEVLDLEEMDETVSLTDFTLDDFRIELLNFLENNHSRLQESPDGIYAVVPSPSDSKNSSKKDPWEIGKDIIKPGVIFCLRQKGDSEGNEEINPLNPYFLVYVRNDGYVRYNYTHAKHVLEIFRLLCQGKTIPHGELCELFNEETCNGENMDTYTFLLKKTVDEIIRIFKIKSRTKLLSNRGALLIPKSKQLSEIDNFELITWLIIK